MSKRGRKKRYDGGNINVRLPHEAEVHPPFTTDEAQTATLIYTEGTFVCHKVQHYLYPAIEIKMCSRDALQPAARTFNVSIIPHKATKIICQPELFPPDGKGNGASGSWENAP